jgi:hypothetical protein
LLVVLLNTLSVAQQKGWRKGVWISGPEAPEDVKSAWPDNPPMRGGAPLADREPVKTPPSGPTGRERAAASLLEPLWSTPTHSFIPNQNVVTGLALRSCFFECGGRELARRALRDIARHWRKMSRDNMIVASTPIDSQ